MSRFVKGDPRARQGRARQRELAEEAETERRQIETELLHGLGRQATATDKIAAESLSAAVIRARKLRASGRDDAEERKLINQLMRAAGGAFKPAPPDGRIVDPVAELHRQFAVRDIGSGSGTAA